MLENGDSKLQKSLECIPFEIFSKLPNFKIMAFTPHPISQLWKLTLPPESVHVIGLYLFSLKWRERMNFNVWGALVFWAMGKTVWGLLQSPFGELGLIH